MTRHLHHHSVIAPAFLLLFVTASSGVADAQGGNATGPQVRPLALEAGVDKAEKPLDKRHPIDREGRFQAKLLQADRNTVQRIVLPAIHPWTFTPEAVDVQVSVRKTQFIDFKRVREEIGKGWNLAGVFLVPTSDAKLLTVHVDFGQLTGAKLAWFNLANPGGRVMSTRAPLLPLDVSPDGTRLIGHGIAKKDAGDKKRLDLWRVDGTQVEYEGSWTPYTHSFPIWAGFVDSNHAWTVSANGHLTYWEIPIAKAIYEVDVGHLYKPSLTPNRKYLIGRTRAGVVVLNASTGEPLATLPIVDDKVTDRDDCYSISPNGQYLARTTRHRLFIWEMSSGSLYRSIYHPSATDLRSEPRIDWGEPGFILIGESWLIDFEQRACIWDYRGSETDPSPYRSRGSVGSPKTSQSFAGGYWWYSGNSLSPGLYHSLLPHSDAKSAAKSLSSQKLPVQPGTKVTLEVKVTGTPEQQLQVTETLTRSIRAAGLELADGQPVRVVATLWFDKPREVTYVIGGKKTLSPWGAKIECLRNNVTLWKVESPPTIPSSYDIYKGLDPYLVPDFGFFDRYPVPSHLPDLKGYKTLGASNPLNKNRPLEIMKYNYPKP